MVSSILCSAIQNLKVQIRTGWSRGEGAHELVQTEIDALQARIDPLLVQQKKEGAERAMERNTSQQMAMLRVLPLRMTAMQLDAPWRLKAPWDERRL